MTPAQRRVVRLKPPELSDMEKRLATTIVHVCDMEKRLTIAIWNARRHFEQEVANLKRDIDELRRDHDNLAERQLKGLQQ